jgi:hypothetical protein
MGDLIDEFPDFVAQKIVTFAAEARPMTNAHRRLVNVATPGPMCSWHVATQVDLNKNKGNVQTKDGLFY